MQFEKIKTILSLNQEQYELVAKPALLKICKTGYPDPFGTPFRHVEGNKRLILGYQYGFGHEPELQKALLDYWEEKTEPGFFYSVRLNNESLEKSHNPNYHKYVPRRKMDIIEGEMGPLENVQYSVNGDWAFVFSHENHCLFSGPKAMKNALSKRIPDLKDQVNKFLENWVYMIENYRNFNIETSWIYPLLVHIYDEEKAIVLLKAHGLEYLVT